MMKIIVIAIVILCVLLIFTVYYLTQKQKIKLEPRDSIGLLSLEEISPAQWDQLAEKTLFFAHMSVGANILDGVQLLASEKPKINLKIVESKEPQALAAPGFNHFHYPDYTEPTAKIDVFEQFLNQSTNTHPNIALMKFCYVDMYVDTDVDSLFDDYQKTFESLQKQFPDTYFIHCTVPLRSDLLSTRQKIKEVIRPLLGKPTQASHNYKRHLFNQRIRQTYPSEEIFDIALYESLTHSVQFCYKDLNGQKVPFLFSGYTSDGGHLNEQGRRFLAEQFLIKLAQTEGY